MVSGKGRRVTRKRIPNTIMPQLYCTVKWIFGPSKYMRIDTVNSFDVHRRPCALRAFRTKARIVMSVSSARRASLLLAQSLAEAQRELRDFPPPPLPARAVASMMNAEEIPNWVPAAVKKLAVQFRFSEELVRRLVTDPKMKSVWHYLLHRAQPVGSEFAGFGAALEFWGLSEIGVSVQEQACALFFQNVVIEMCAPMAATTRQDIENLVAPWRSAAEQCRSAIGCLSSNSANSELVKALSLSAKHFEARADVAEEDANSPYTLKRRSGKPEDNTVRGRVRALALISRGLYGSFQYRILASMATVALQTNVTEKSVRNWCSDLHVAPEDSTAR